MPAPLAAPASSTVYLGPGHHLHCAQQAPVWLSVLRGRVWVTHALDPDDHFLDPGQSIRLPAGAQALVGAEGPAQVTLLEERGASRWRMPGATIGAPPLRSLPQP